MYTSIYAITTTILLGQQFFVVVVVVVAAVIVVVVFEFLVVAAAANAVLVFVAEPAFHVIINLLLRYHIVLMQVFGPNPGPKECEIRAVSSRAK